MSHREYLIPILFIFTVAGILNITIANVPSARISEFGLAGTLLNNRLLAQAEVNPEEEEQIRIAKSFLGAIREAAAIYKYISRNKGGDNFIAEVSMDEVNNPQTPVELFFILLMIKQYDIPAQTIAPKFTGRFNKGVDYVGDVDQFRKEFEQDLLVIDHAINTFGLPENLKLSVHSGSDKFTIYPVMGELIKKYDKGIHVKTAGTTWLEEVIGLAMAGGEALQMSKNIYSRAYERRDELCGPYATVIELSRYTS